MCTLYLLSPTSPLIITSCSLDALVWLQLARSATRTSFMIYGNTLVEATDWHIVTDTWSYSFSPDLFRCRPRKSRSQSLSHMIVEDYGSFSKIPKGAKSTLQCLWRARDGEKERFIKIKNFIWYFNFRIYYNIWWRSGFWTWYPGQGNCSRFFWSGISAANSRNLH